jgi:hypothetical protein
MLATVAGIALASLIAQNPASGRDGWSHWRANTSVGVVKVTLKIKNGGARFYLYRPRTGRGWCFAGGHLLPCGCPAGR